MWFTTLTSRCTWCHPQYKKDIGQGSQDGACLFYNMTHHPKSFLKTWRSYSQRYHKSNRVVLTRKQRREKEKHPVKTESTIWLFQFGQFEMICVRKKGDRASCLLREVRAQTEVWLVFSRGTEQVDSRQDSVFKITVRDYVLVIQYVPEYVLYSMPINLLL